MKKPRVEMKNVKTFRGREGEGFNATLYINGQKSAFVFDDASGGPYNYEVYDNVSFAELNFYVNSLPDLNTEYGKIKMNMDVFLWEYIY